MKTLSLPTPASKLDANVRVPGSKSYANRALICAALANGTSRLEGFSISKDSELLVEALRELGITITFLDPETVEVIGTGGTLPPQQKRLNVGPAGTVMRFLTSLCAFLPGEFELFGTERMHQRPIGDLVEALQQLGVTVEYLGREGCPPLKITGKDFSNTPEETLTTRLKGANSSQFLTSLLLSAPLLGKPLHIDIEGDLISSSYVRMTEQAIQAFGGVIQSTASTFISQTQEYSAQTYQVEPDLSGATYLWAMGALGGKIRVNHVNPKSLQGDVHFPRLLEQMGCHVVYGNDFIEVQSTETLTGITCDMEQLPDTAQTLAVVAAFAVGKTTITGLSTLRKKETDRLAALQNELKKMDIKTDITNDSITIHGGAPKPAQIATYEDHRMAMAFAVAATRLDGMIIEEPDVVEKSFPSYWDLMTTVFA